MKNGDDGAGPATGAGSTRFRGARWTGTPEKGLWELRENLNSRIGELGSSAQHAATVAGGKVFEALGVGKNVAYHGGRAMDPHMHCSFYDEQEEPLRRAIRAHLTRTAEPDGRMEPQPAGTANLEEWIEWDTPVLQ